MKSTQTLYNDELASEINSAYHKEINQQVMNGTIKAFGTLMKKILLTAKSQLFITLLPTDTSF